MFNFDRDDQSYKFFIEEAIELLEVIETGLLSIKNERDIPKVHEIMRAAHSIKGGAASVNLDGIKTLAHRLEDIFKALYSEDVEIDTHLEGLLLQGYDCLRLPLMEQIDTGYFDPEAALANATPIFAQLEERLGNAINEVDDFIPSSSDLGIDLVSSIFEIDVAQGLEQLSIVVAQSESYNVADELRTQLEVFGGFAELLNLPGFGAIAKTALQALDLNPEQALSITHLSLADFQLARQAVLAGDRSQGGSPSEALVELANNTITESTEKIEIQTPTEDIVFDNITKPIQEVIETSATTAKREEIATTIPTPDNLPDYTFETDKVDEIDIAAIAPPIEADEPIAQETPSLDDIFGNTFEMKEGDELHLADVFSSEVNEPIILGAPSLPIEVDEPIILESPPLPIEVDEPIILESPPLPIEVDEPIILESPPLPIEVDEPIILESPSLPTEVNEPIILGAPSLPTEVNEPIAQEVPSLDDIFGQAFETNEIEEKEPDISTTAFTGEIKQSPQSKSQIDQSTQENQTKISRRKDEALPITNLSVRVDFKRLERMNNLVGELVINRNNLSSKNELLQNTAKKLRYRLAQLQTLTENLRELSDHILITSENLGETSTPKTQEQLITSSIDLKSIDIHDYREIYPLIQGVLGEILQFEEVVDDLTLFTRESNQSLEKQRQMLTGLGDELMWARMLPIGDMLKRFPRILRDLSTKYQKPVNLKMNGTDVLIDKAVLEKLHDPLLHLLRNAFDHGIESPEIRLQQGKSEESQIEINAYHQGNQTIIEVKDNGQGLNVEKISARAIQQGLLSAQQLTVTERESLLDLIFEPGFSTAKQVSELSGRGMGLDVVRSQLRSLKGKVSVTSSVGEGTTFILSLPLNLTITKLRICQVDTTTFAFPSTSIKEIIALQSEQIKQSEGQRLLQWENQQIPIYRLIDLLNYNCPLPENFSLQTKTQDTSTKNEALSLLIMPWKKQFFALEIERVITEQEMMIKPFGGAIAPPSYTYGCTIVEDGSLVPVINGTLLLELVLGKNIGQAWQNQIEQQQQLATQANANISSLAATFLIIDDSRTIRHSVTKSLQKAGYRVLEAADGLEGLEALKKNSQVKLVICDIDMPNMNGLEFLDQYRRNPKINKIPVVMLTSRSNKKHRQLAIHLGAKDYFIKPYIEIEFIENLKNILEQKEK